MKNNVTYVLELNNPKEINNRVFRIFYNDSITNIELDAFFRRVYTPVGVHWMFIINNDDFPERKDVYLEVVRKAYEGMLPKLQNKFKFNQRKILVDHKYNISY